MFIHQHAPISSLVIIRAVLCTEPQQSTPEKGNTPSALGPNKADPHSAPVLLAPVASWHMMAEALHWDGLSLGEPS